jgi:hypothetical protein
MRPSEHSLAFFLGLTLPVFAVATLGSEVFARVTIAGETMDHAMREHFRFASLGGAMYLFAPFALLGLICGVIAKLGRFARATQVFCAGAFLILGLYLGAYRDAQVYLKRNQWTASALSVGFVPYSTIPVLVGCAITGWLMSRKSRRIEACAPERGTDE